MPMTLSGDGTITGLAAGGLPNGTVQPSDLSTGAPTWDSSGNVGIGTSSPSVKLNIVGGNFGITATATPRIFAANNSGIASDIFLGADSGVAWVGSANTNVPLYFATNNTERMRVGTDGVITSGLGGMQVISGTAVSASGTAVNFTGIPSWVKKITVMFQGVSTNGTSPVQIQIGSGSFTTTGYTYGATVIAAGTLASAASTSASGFPLEVTNGGVTAATARSGICQIANINGNSWCQSGSFSHSGSAIIIANSAGSVSLSGTLDRVRITTVNGTDTFDAGTINILYE